MALPITNYGNSAPNPGAAGEAFIPDQLIAGNMKLVTEHVTITGGAALKRGTVLGQITNGGITSANGANTGNGTVGSLSTGTRARSGAYKLTAKSATVFAVVNPHGVVLPDATVGVAYVNPELNFTLTAGGTPFVANDNFTLTIAAGSGLYKIAAAAAVDGSQNPVAILVADTDATGGDVGAGIYQMGEFTASAVTLGAGMTLAVAKAALRLLGIFLKSGVSAADPT